MLTAIPTKQQTCSGCPNWQQQEYNHPNSGWCPLYHEQTLGHDLAGPSCPEQDEQGKAQGELNALIQEQADVVAPEYELRVVEELVTAVEIGYKTVGYVYFGLGKYEWYVNHTDRPFAGLREAADSVAIFHGRRQNVAVTQGTLATAINQFHGVRIIGEDITGWQEDGQGCWTVTVTDTAQPYTVTLEQLEEANRQPEYTVTEIEEIEADIDRF